MASSSSIVLPSVSCKTLVFNKTINRNPSLSFFTPSLSFKTLGKPLSLSSSESLLLPLRTSRLLPSRVAVYDQEEEVSGGRRSDADFSPDLKLFVGNLPFNVDSGELAELFGQAGNVEVVEVSMNFFHLGILLEPYYT